MAKPIAVDPDWLADHPLPDHAASADKDDRGHVLVIGGSRRVPGGLRLTAEAALRAGAGRLQLATLESLAVSVGLAVPEAAMLSLPEDGDGEIRWETSEPLARSLDRSDCTVIGPAMAEPDAAGPIVTAVLEVPGADGAVVLDAAAIGSGAGLGAQTARFAGCVVVTPNRGEMARLLDTDIDKLADDPEGAAERAVERTGASVVFKGPRTVLATPAGELLSYPGGVGLATGGSGDVLSGILGGLLARGGAGRSRLCMGCVAARRGRPRAGARQGSSRLSRARAPAAGARAHARGLSPGPGAASRSMSSCPGSSTTWSLLPSTT